MAAAGDASRHSFCVGTLKSNVGLMSRVWAAMYTLVSQWRTQPVFQFLVGFAVTHSSGTPADGALISSHLALIECSRCRSFVQQTYSSFRTGNRKTDKLLVFFFLPLPLILLLLLHAANCTTASVCPPMVGAATLFLQSAASSPLTHQRFFASVLLLPLSSSSHLP